ncbi:hypothetical protein OAB57_02405 [Bacteriovoracaceae bacterium]|nr:hypothetical protein [Bacteriovoracaceae bacterium]
MKGTHVHQGIEHKINIEGEEWPQGSALSGTYDKVIHRSNDNKPYEGVALVACNLRKLKKKDPQAYFVIDHHLVESGSESFKWRFQLPNWSFITDKSHSYYILYGTFDQLEKNSYLLGDGLGQLQLHTILHPRLQNLLGLMQTFLRFALKDVKNGKKDNVVAKLVAPECREWSFIYSFELHLKMDEELTIHIDYLVTVNQLTHEQIGKQIKQTKKTFSQSLSAKEFILYENDFHPEKVVKEINTVLSELRPKLLY